MDFERIRDFNDPLVPHFSFNNEPNNFISTFIIKNVECN